MKAGDLLGTGTISGNAR